MKQSGAELIPSALVRLLTVGVYGSDGAAFFAALEAAGADILLDIRTRRAVRGTRYSYANAKRLIAELGRRGIAYRHVIGLAPGRELLALQHGVDKREGHAYSARTVLAKTYVHRYIRDVLDRFDVAELARELAGYRAPVLMCVERIPAACHRSLVAPRLAQALHARRITDLIPDTPPA